MSQNGRREFLTSAAAAAALAACTAPVRRAQAAAVAPCGCMYDEGGLVSACALHFHDPGFLPKLVTFSVPSPTTAGLTPSLVAKTLDAMNNIMHVSMVRVKANDGSLALGGAMSPPDPLDLPLGFYELIPLGGPPGNPPSPDDPAKPGRRSPVVLSLAQYMAISSPTAPAGAFRPDWKTMLMFVVPDRVGASPSPGGAFSAMCAHPFGM
jgi:hypothetical protein